ncbi:related to serine threonine kinase and endoribonuclease ERN1 IRE1, sensor of the unfolded [Lecanosticta acicola]|uniref:non-specific serine/threonine protein kinase n=1 Tax=Lecanosticta acicola TaxID=111012 RepID=A0AAI9E931_9PEZI|nr:related to serine threonine kinase and endoribonuclease ERN1 IRE1, sensor of the unfolded [Lecanosticta acicola]
MPPGGGRPPGSRQSPSLRVRDLITLSFLLPIAASALQQQPLYPPEKHRPADDLANAASAAEKQWATVADTLQTPHSGQRGFRDTDISIQNKNDKSVRTSARPKDGALATVSSAAANSAASGQPPASLPASTAGITTRQPARNLQDWQVEDIMLLATVDGSLYARDRKTGAHRWKLESDREMVESIRHRHNNTVDENGLEQEDPLFVVEPSQDGIIYLLTPGFGLQRLPYTVKQLADLAPYAGDGYPAVAYTAEKKNTIYTVDAATGNILKIFSSAGSIVNDDRSCRKASPLDLEEPECDPIGTLTLSRTEYTIGIQDRNTAEPINTIRYFEWGTNNRDHDLRSKYQSTMDNRYIYPKFNGYIQSVEVDPGKPKLPSSKKVSYQKKFATPVARVFDVVRPLGDPSSDAALVILPQPQLPKITDGKSDDEDIDNVWVNCTDSGNWYALSESRYPRVTERAPQARYYDLVGSSKGVPLSRNIFAGVHYLSTDNAPPGSNRIGGNNRLTIDAPAEEIIYGRQTDLTVPHPAQNSINTLATVVLTLVMIGLVSCGVLYKQYGIAPWNLKLPPLAPRITLPNGEVAELGKPLPETPMLREGEPAKETIFPHDEGNPAPRVRFTEPPKEEGSPDNHEAAAEGDEDAKEGAEPKKKKATRGKRAGRKQKEKEAAQAEFRAQKYGTAVPQVAEVISVAASESSQVSGPLQINSLVIHTDKIIGTGSCGTSVFEGSFEGRAVAVKRMLSQYYALASQEVSFLQQSDDHPNVVRYFCQQKDDHFLYIAVELCQASLFETWKPDVAKLSEERLQQLQTLKSAMQQDMTKTLQQLAAGLHHLHNLRIIHRDIKPQNILVAFPKKSHLNGTRLVISDFGLGKNLPENVSTLNDQTANAGTAGWKAPELITQPRETSSNNTHSTSNNSESGAGAPSGVKRAADIFSLGCLFFWVLTDGVHPFEDENGWMQLRELNIKRDRKNMDALEKWSDAYEPMQLISSMLEHQPENRPTAQTVLNHPYFWSPEKRLAFLCDCSDHFEREPRGTYEDDYAGDSVHLRMLEDRAEEVIGAPYERADFLSKLDRQFVDTLGKQRKYSGNRLLDLLRALRNKKNHYEDMPEHVKKHVGPLAGGYLSYWGNRFPKLLMTCYEVIHKAGVQGNDRFKGYFALGNP